MRLARNGGFPLRLGFRSSGKVRAGLADAVRWVRPPGGDNVGAAARVASDERVLNLPNVISISRMVSGPVIGWYVFPSSPIFVNFRRN